MYDGMGDPDNQIDYFKLMMQYRIIEDKVKCKNFPLTLEKSALLWFRQLRSDSISSWEQLDGLYSSRLTASRMKPKSEEVVRAFKHGERETLREYVFNKETANVVNLEERSESSS